MVLAKLIQAAEIDPEDHVLDVGCATGYRRAQCWRGSPATWWRWKRTRSLPAAASAALAGIANVTLATGALAAGWPQAAPYDVILLEGATEVVPHALCAQLKDGGRLVCVLGAGPGAKAMLYRRSGDDFSGRPVFDAAAPLLAGLCQTARFRLLNTAVKLLMRGMKSPYSHQSVRGAREGVLSPGWRRLWLLVAAGEVRRVSSLSRLVWVVECCICVRRREWGGAAAGALALAVALPFAGQPLRRGRTRSSRRWCRPIRTTRR